MKIIEFKELIKHLPYKNHSLVIKKKNWNCENQKELIDSIFNGKEIIYINRLNLFNSNKNIEEFIIKTLMWGYPTKGRGNNIENVLHKDNFEKLKNILLEYSENNISLEKLKYDLKTIKGVNISTFSKFLYFLNSTINNNRCIILDLKIINVISNHRFDDFNDLKGITYDNAISKYEIYLNRMKEIAHTIDVEIDKLELFLFIFGNNLSNVEDRNN